MSLTRKTSTLVNGAFLYGILLLLSCSEIGLASNFPVSESHEKSLDESARCVREHHYKKAYKKFSLLAKHGCPYSQCIVGVMHQHGIGTEKNTARAHYWYRKSAKQGFKDAQFRLGMMHFNAEGVAKNLDTAAHWLRQSANQGMSEAASVLSEIEKESGKALNSSEAFAGKEFRQGLQEAQTAAGQMPALPVRATQAEPGNVYASGLEGLQKSWVGYVDVVKNLDSLSSASASK